MRTRTQRLGNLGIAAALTAVAACSPGPPQSPEGPSIDEILDRRPRVLWVAAHPDDESMGGPVLARACLKYDSPCHFVVFNKGRGGECNVVGGCKPDLGTMRNRELVKAARLYRAAVEHYDFFNASLPVSSFPTRPELERRWMSEGDPAGIVARAIRRFQPDIVVSLDPYRGFTGHPEHQATARFAIAGIRLAADSAHRNPMFSSEPPHRVKHVIHVQNKYWFMQLAGDPPDPKPHHEQFANTDPCDELRGQKRRCVDAIAANTRVHASQDSDMAAVRTAAKFWGTAYIRRLDPFGEEATELISELGIEGLN